MQEKGTMEHFNVNKEHSAVLIIGCSILVLSLILLASLANAETSLDENGNTTLRRKTGPVDQTLISVGRGYHRATCGQVPLACNQSQTKAVDDGVCEPEDSAKDCQVKMDARSLPVVSYKQAGIAFGVCSKSDTLAECRALMKIQAISRSRDPVYKSLDPDDGQLREFCMSKDVQEDDTIIYGSLSDDDCFKFTVKSGGWPDPRSKTIPRLASAGHFSEYATHEVNDLIFRDDGMTVWAKQSVDESNEKNRNSRPLEDLEEVP